MLQLFLIIQRTDFEHDKSSRQKQQTCSYCLFQNMFQFEKKKQLKDRANSKYQEQRQKAIYLKTGFSSILDKIAANKLIPEDQQQNLMQGDDVLTDALLSQDKKVFDSFGKQPQTADQIFSEKIIASLQYQLASLVILSKLRWFNEMNKEIELQLAQVKTSQSQRVQDDNKEDDDDRDLDTLEEQKKKEEEIKKGLEALIKEEELRNFTLDDDEKVNIPDEPVHTLKIDFPTSRPTSKGPLGGTKGQRIDNQPPQALKVLDRAAMKQKTKELLMTQQSKGEDKSLVQE
ncbi:Conserved_hypothetical protein [Hexamita inflata]|uniref:Uncharacterized protein n=1 Tax=Hexamita inflata TaxID=28002 RepID=A0AA86UC23_9EUKA|nr:Conserved hypothetical protein [Hexamita inflata]